MNIWPSICAADIFNLTEELKKLNNLNIAGLHVDVMDGHFVPELTHGLPLVRSLKKQSHFNLDVHIMVTNPECTAQSYLDAGAHSLTFHMEACLQPYKLIKQIKDNGVKAGIALSPHQHWNQLEYLFPYLDQVLIMTVVPGFSGQKYLDSMSEKIIALTQFLKEKKLSTEVRVDGGITYDIVPQLSSWGVNSCVMGNAFFHKTNKHHFLDGFPS